jgi:preprotein translocase subunit SecA
MAGRGTDIKLAPECEAAGGLHVILSERHDAGRIDRQLAGRCARQGDPGSYEALLSMEDQLLQDYGSVLRLLGAGAGSRALKHAQRRAEALHSAERRRLFRADDKLTQLLSFSGSPE